MIGGQISMSYGFEQLEPEYENLFGLMHVQNPAVMEAIAEDLLKDKEKYVNVSNITGVPIVLLMAFNEREDSANFNCYLGNGDPLDTVTRDVPRGRGPFKTWDDGACDALNLEGMCGIKDWTWALLAYWAERWNGWGYRLHGKHSAYLWAGTNIYTGGKFTSDGDFDANAFDAQPGVIPLMRAIVALDPSLDLPGWPAQPDVPAPVAVPEAGGTIGGVKWVQESLNTLDNAGLAVDGSLGRLTRAAIREFQTARGLTVDGIAGPETKGAIASALAKVNSAPATKAAASAAVLAILDRDVADLVRGSYAFPGDAPVTWDYVDIGTDTGVKLFVKEIGGVSVWIFPGTEDIQDCIRDLDALAETPLDDPAFGPVHPGGNKGVADCVKRAIAKSASKIIVGGHSLGALHADNAAGYLIQAGRPPLARVVFGEPRPGFAQFAAYIKAVPARAYRNEAGIIGDPVTSVPFKLTEMPYVHPCKQTGFTADPSWNDPWGPVAPHRMQLYTQGLANVSTSTSV